MKKDYEIAPLLEKKLRKLIIKDKELYEATVKKIEEIAAVGIEHYKNLRAPMQQYKRTHVKGSFVLLFSAYKDKIIFDDLDHHDKIYK